LNRTFEKNYLARPMSKHLVYLCLGGNLGERHANLEEAATFVLFNMGDILNASSVYESAAWGMNDAPEFLNQVLLIETELSPEQLLEEINELEEFYGRERSDNEYLSREMDVDILFFDDLVLSESTLSIPHPRIAERRFVLTPMAEIAPTFVHPVLKLTMQELLDKCQDMGVVKVYDGK
jgi:2-amino-4-hydroxy-6-hydroxymethyldihydropteridine diphosphokinase